jgi:hypothetical protein
MYRYTAFGLGIDSELPLPQLPLGAGDTSVRICLGHVQRNLAKESKHPVSGYISIGTEEVYVAYEQEATYLVRAGREIIVDPCPGVESGRLQVRLTGVVMALLLQQRSSLVLHGNAVADGNGVIALIGVARAGKSTLTALLLQYGYTFVTDDVVAVEVRQTERSEILPGFPQMKLWPDTLEHLGWPLEVAPRFWPDWDKRHWSVNGLIPSEGLKLRQIYVLEEGDDIAIEPLTGKAAFMMIVQHLYHAGLMTALDPAGCYFRSCIQMVDQVRVCRLRRPKNFRINPDVLRRLADDLLSCL